MTAQPRILMCPPDFYGIEYEINPWMNRQRQADHELAVTQWRALRDLLLSLGAQIEQLSPIRGLPDLVFTANAALIYRNRCILSNFRHEQRQRETPVNDAWFREHGFEVEALPPHFHFEGAGDALFCGDTLFAGYQIRSHAGGHQEVAARLGHRVIPLALVDDYFYHLDTCFCPLRPGLALYFPGAFDEYGQRALQEHVAELVAVYPEEAREFACNAVVVGQQVVTNTGCPKLSDQLREVGFEPHATPLSEFVKAGGSAKCLTLRLDGEEAASWKHTT